MTKLGIKVYFDKIIAWCVQHWRWLVFACVALVAYLAGRKNSRSLWMQAELARKQYKRESQAIEAAHRESAKRKKEAEERYERSIMRLDAEYKKKNSVLQKEKDKEYKKLLKIAKDDPEQIDNILKYLGIKEV